MHEPATPRLEARRPRPLDDLEPDAPAEVPTVAWGSEDDAPAPMVTLGPDLPIEAATDDLDPATLPLLDGPAASFGGEVTSVVGVRFAAAGRLQWCDAGEFVLGIDELVVVDSERGPRVATVATVVTRRASRDRGARRVIRRAAAADLRTEQDGEAERSKALRIAKDTAAKLRLPLKVFRVELHGALGRGAKVLVYYTSDERLDLRDLVRDLSTATGGRVELRQLGGRDEAKAIGGIGSCGLTLCCTTWLPEFVPVSIKMAKDQGLVLAPNKVSGQCGRLKCCLVYEQAAYAEARKGLPKLGKRVVSARGEGRVVEVDVLRQRVRVSYGMGDTEVLPATEVKPLFAPGGGPGGPGGEAGDSTEPAGRRGAREGRDRRDARDRPPADEPPPPPSVDAEVAAAVAAEVAAMTARLADAPDDDEPGATDDPSSDHFRADDDEPDA